MKLDKSQEKNEFEDVVAEHSSAMIGKANALRLQIKEPVIKNFLLLY
jgi:hypothetical protein